MHADGVIYIDFCPYTLFSVLVYMVKTRRSVARALSPSPALPSVPGLARVRRRPRVNWVWARAVVVHRGEALAAYRAAAAPPPPPVCWKRAERDAIQSSREAAAGAGRGRTREGRGAVRKAQRPAVLPRLCSSYPVAAR